MTGRPKGVLQKHKRVWHTNCATCSATIKQSGSGPPRKYCNARCKGKHPANLEKMRNRARSKRKSNGKVRVFRRETNRQILVAEKSLRGECALHPLYNNGERKFVVPGLEYLFDMDHLDRHNKNNTIAKMVGDPEKRFRDEIAKCQMLCMECHRRKTVESRDWVHIVKVLEPQMKTVYDQPTLFDN